MQGPEQIHVSKFYKESKNGKFVSYITENVRTLYQTFREGAYASNNGPCLGWRETLTSPYQVSQIHSYDAIATVPLEPALIDLIVDQL